MTQRGRLVPRQLIGHPANRWQALESRRVLEAVLQNPFSLPLGLGEGVLIPTGQSQVWLIIVGCILIDVKSQLPLGAPLLQGAGVNLTLAQSWPIRHKVIAIHIFGSGVGRVSEEAFTVCRPLELALEAAPQAYVLLDRKSVV